ncbi:DUF1080 domain-containing protein [bacterium]|nr:DUF1080 domain-containing protein [bacterium]
MRQVDRCWMPMAVGLILLAVLTSEGAETEEGFVPLFNGRNLSGWVTEGPCKFIVKGSEIYCPGVGNYPSWLRSEESFENVVIRFEFRMFLYGEGGLFLHAPKHGRNNRVGFEVQLSDEIRNRQPSLISTGAIFDAVPPKVQAARPLGEWNDVEVRFDWPQLQVTLNGVLVQDLDVERNPELKHRLRSGYLGWQDRGKAYSIRNARVKRLPDRDTTVSIFNGKDLSGWKVLEGGGSASFLVDEGSIVARNGNGYLISDKEYQDYDLFCYVKTSHPASNGGIFLRWKSLVPKDRGYEIQIEDIPDSNNPTGSIYDWSKATGLLPTSEGEWYPMQIHLRGSNCVVRVNGVTVASADDLPLIRSGPVALQMHSSNKTIWFKDIRIRELPTASPEEK